MVGLRLVRLRVLEAFPRERLPLRLPAAVTQIAERLFVGKVTVRTHVAAILKKLRVSDRDAAVRIARGETD